MAAKQHACLANNPHEPELTRRPRLLAPPVRNRHFRCTMDLWPRTIPQHRRRRGVRHSGPGQRGLDSHVNGLSPRRRGNPAPAVARREAAVPFRVYPRAGGGTIGNRYIDANVAGLSPRRRGNRLAVHKLRTTPGSIPAQAGEPDASPSSPGRPPVYPRAGGGTPCDVHHLRPLAGLSPRRRGNHPDREFRWNDTGSIPAQAGEPCR